MGRGCEGGVGVFDSFFSSFSKGLSWFFGVLEMRGSGRVMRTERRCIVELMCER